MVLLWLLAVLTPIGDAIVQFCGGDSVCAEAQRTSLRHFLGIQVMFEAPPVEAERCMRAGKRGRSVDWTVSEKCLRDWAAGRTSIVGKKLPKP